MLRATEYSPPFTYPMLDTEKTIEKRIFISRYKRSGKHFMERLSDGLDLDMVLISGGKFLMGAPEDELESQDRERPQHQVTVPSIKCQGGRRDATVGCRNR